MKQVTTSFIRDYAIGGKRHAGYKETVEIYNHLRFHIDGYNKRDDNPFFKNLIDTYRPGESDEVKKFRKDNYCSITTLPCYKVINSLKKIIRSEDWSINFKETALPSIRKGEQVQDYFKEKYPGNFKSIDNWAMSFAIKALLSDPNAVIYTLPNTAESVQDYNTPLSHIAHSNNVLDFDPWKLVVIHSTEKVTFVQKNTQYTNGNVYYVYQPGSIHRCEQQSLDFKRFNIIELLSRDSNEMYAHRPGFGEIVHTSGGVSLYNSFLSPMLPYLDAAAREGSDLTGSVVNHLHPREWYFSGVDCGTCSGEGAVNKNGRNVACDNCDGSGRLLKSPFSAIILKQAEFGKETAPVPPAGVVQRDTSIIEIQEKRIQKHMLNALSTINMEFLAETPLNESGYAKDVDKDELNNYVYGVAFSLVNDVLSPTIDTNISLRYGVAVDQSGIEDLKPDIKVPQKFDLLSRKGMVDQIKSVSDSGVDSSVITELQKDYISKSFREDPKKKDRLHAIMSLNPLSGKTPDFVDSALLSGRITKKDAVIFTYIEHFVDKAMREDEEFLKKPIAQQLDVINQMADLKITELSGFNIEPSEEEEEL